MEKKDILIVGNGIAADIIYGYLKNDKRYQVKGFLVHKKFIETESKFDLPIYLIEEVKEMNQENQFLLMMGIGYTQLNKLRAQLFEELLDLGFEFETYIHPSAVVHENVSIGEGSMVLSNSVVEPYAKIGVNSFIWSNCTIAHHSEVQSHCWIASNTVLSGEALIKDFSFVGVNCTIVNKVTVESLNIIGAGSLITKNTKPKEVFLTRNAEKHRFDSINYAKFFL